VYIKWYSYIHIHIQTAVYYFVRYLFAEMEKKCTRLKVHVAQGADKVNKYLISV